MSMHAMLYVRHRKTSPTGDPLTHNEKMAWYMMADYADGVGEAFVSLATLASDLLVSTATITRVIDGLKRKGCISIARTYKRRDGQPSYRWQIISADVARADDVDASVILTESNTQAEYYSSGEPVIINGAISNPHLEAPHSTRVNNPINPKNDNPARVDPPAIIVGSTNTVAARAETSVPQRATEIQLPTIVGQARETHKSPRPAASGSADAPPELQPYLDALDRLRSVGPLVGRQNTATCRDRRLREVRRLYVAKVPPTALAGYDATQPAPIIADAFSDARAVQWALTEHAPAKNTHPTANRQNRLAELQAKQRSLTSGNGGTGAAAQLPGVVGNTQRSVSGFPSPVPRQLPDTRGGG